MKKVIVVGGGVGGLCTGIRLLNKGFKVIILEKENTLGGKVNKKEKNGFRFDLTASILMTPNIYTDIFKDVGKDYRDYIELIKLDPIYKVNYYDGSEYNFYSDLRKMCSVLEDMESGLSQKYMMFLSNSLDKYLVSKEYILNKPMLKLRDAVNYKTFKKLVEIKPIKNTNKYISNIMDNKKLKEYLMFQSMYIGVDPFKNSNLYSLIPTISHLYGLYYIKGGFYKYIEALEKLFYELGGIVYKNTEVKEIIVENNKVLGIKANNRIYKCDNVICNVDYPYAIKNLFKQDLDEKFYNKSNIDKKELSCSVFIIYLGLKKKYYSLNVHNIYINKDFKCNIKAAFKGKLPKHPSVYMYYPSLIDNTLCEDKQKSTLNIMVRVPNLSYENIQWSNKNIVMFRNIIMDEIKKIKGLEDIEKNIEYEDYLTPEDLKEKFNAYNGNAFGLSHKLTQSGYLRPHMKCNNIDGLYFIGSSCHPGNGVSVIIEGSKVLEKIIIRRFK